MVSRQVVYYKDELTDDFSDNSKIKTKKIDKNYKYIHKNIFWNLCSFVLYRIIMTPYAYLYMKLKFGLKFVNRQAIKDCKHKGFFVYSNHTQEIGDAFIPTLLNFPKKTYVVVHPNNISIPFWGNIIKFLGPLPLPGDIGAGKNFVSSIERLINNKNVITIYPEAHVWNYYTKIRNYSKDSFKYPAKFNAPVFIATTTYKKRKKKIPQIVVYIDGPFIAPNGLNINEKSIWLRNKALNIMNERALNSNAQFIEYVKVSS